MNMHTQIDTSFDFRSDTPTGKDPDAFSPTLRRYHRILWSKPLPNGKIFTLDDKSPNYYLHHRSELGEYFLSSDSVIPTFTRNRRISHIIDQIHAEDRESFVSISYTIGGMLIFPGNRIDGKSTINGARGFHPRIKDRFDLTVECIRRYYLGKSSPLEVTLNRYVEYFRLFETFDGYVKYFLLQDIVDDDLNSVKFFLPFNDFMTSPLPLSLEDYFLYKQLAMEFVNACNFRIKSFMESLTKD